VNDLLHGTLEVLVLKVLAEGPLHGYGIARWLEAVTEDALRIEEGSLYPALYRMEKRRWIGAEWGRSELGRRVKVYRILPRGRKKLEERMREWEAFSSAVTRVLGGAAPGEGGAR
jgi:transcriptional regulator